MKCSGCKEDAKTLIYIPRPKPFKLCWECIRAIHKLYNDIKEALPHVD